MNNKIAEPTLEEWRALYKNAIEFKEMAPWKWMSDVDIFDVQNPVDGEIGYCCILGNAGEFFGLAVYLGTEGLMGYLKIMNDEISIEKDPFELLLSKKCLLVSFENKGSLTKSDINMIKELELKFQGRYAWPQFRYYGPGYYPWYLNCEQVIFLTQCLEQAKIVAGMFKNNPALLNPPNENLYFVRIPKKENGNIIWEDKWLEPVPFTKIVHLTKELNCNQINTILQIAEKTRIVWEIDTFYMQEPVKEKDEKPFYPIVSLCVDRGSDFVFGVDLASGRKYEDKFVEFFLKVLEQHRIIPGEVCVKKEELFTLLKPLADIFGFEIKMVNRLNAIDKAKRNFQRFMQRY